MKRYCTMTCIFCFSTNYGVFDGKQQKMRSQLLKDVMIDSRSKKGFEGNKSLRNHAEQLRITLDTLVRAQLFEVHEVFLSM